MEQELIEEQTQDQTFPTLTLSPFCHPVSCGSTLKPWKDYWLSSGARSQSKHLTIIRTVYNEQNSQKWAWNLEAWKCLSCIASPPGLSLWYVACAHGTMHNAEVHSWPQGGRMLPASTLKPVFHSGANHTKTTNWNIPINISPKSKQVQIVCKCHPSA